MSHLYTRTGDYQRAEAHRILDKARSGLDVSTETILWALSVTGDLT